MWVSHSSHIAMVLVIQQSCNFFKDETWKRQTKNWNYSHICEISVTFLNNLLHRQTVSPRFNNFSLGLPFHGLYSNQTQSKVAKVIHIQKCMYSILFYNVFDFPRLLVLKGSQCLTNSWIRQPDSVTYLHRFKISLNISVNKLINYNFSYLYSIYFHQNCFLYKIPKMSIIK